MIYHILHIMNNAYREYIFELLHYKKNIEKLCTSLDKVVISQTMKLKLLTMLYVINADEYMYKTMNNIIHITVSYRFITISEKNAIQECLDKLSNIISELRLKTSNDVFRYITNNFYIVKPFCDIFRSELKLYCYRRGVLINSQKIESFCELEDENELMNKFKNIILPILPMDELLSIEESLKIVRDVFIILV